MRARKELGYTPGATRPVCRAIRISHVPPRSLSTLNWHGWSTNHVTEAMARLRPLQQARSCEQLIPLPSTSFLLRSLISLRVQVKKLGQSRDPCIGDKLRIHTHTLAWHVYSHSITICGLGTGDWGPTPKLVIVAVLHSWPMLLLTTFDRSPAIIVFTNRLLPTASPPSVIRSNPV